MAIRTLVLGQPKYIDEAPSIVELFISNFSDEVKFGIDVH